MPGSVALFISSFKVWKSAFDRAFFFGVAFQTNHVTAFGVSKGFMQFEPKTTKGLESTLNKQTLRAISDGLNPDFSSAQYSASNGQHATNLDSIVQMKH